jgi:hypothetical protein
MPPNARTLWSTSYMALFGSWNALCAPKLDIGKHRSSHAHKNIASSEAACNCNDHWFTIIAGSGEKIRFTGKSENPSKKFVFR